MTRLVAILAALILIAGMSNGVMDTLWFHYSSSRYAEMENQQFLNPKISDTNKYAHDADGNLIVAPDTWYYRTFKLKYKERYLLSATLFSFTTDAWHLFKFFYQSAWKLVVIVIGLAWFTRNHEGPKWKLIVMGLAAFVVLTIIQSIGFHITYTFIK